MKIATFVFCEILQHVLRQFDTNHFLSGTQRKRLRCIPKTSFKYRQTLGTAIPRDWVSLRAERWGSVLIFAAITVTKPLSGSLPGLAMLLRSVLPCFASLIQNRFGLERVHSSHNDPWTENNFDPWHVFIRVELEDVALSDFYILNTFPWQRDFCRPNFPGHGFGPDSFSHHEMKNATIVPAWLLDWTPGYRWKVWVNTEKPVYLYRWEGVFLKIPSTCFSASQQATFSFFKDCSEGRYQDEHQVSVTFSYSPFPFRINSFPL
jgi:hypothetical protein